MASPECEQRFGPIGTSSVLSFMPGTCTNSTPKSVTPKPSSGARSSASSPEQPSTNEPSAPSAAVEGARGVRSNSAPLEKENPDGLHTLLDPDPRFHSGGVVADPRRLRSSAEGRPARPRHP